MNEETLMAVMDIRSRIKDFNIGLVFNYLKELNRADSNKAEALNNPIGWEEIWCQLKA